MDSKINAPGIYEIDEAAYHGSEICAGPSVSSSGLRTLLSECPAKFWWHSPLNPKREERSKPGFDFGKAAHHFLLLGGDAFFERFFITDPDLHPNTKEAKAQKAQAIGEGKTFIGADDFEKIRAMAEALKAHEFAWAAFANGRAEPTLAWQDAETGVWCRTRPDTLPNALTHIPDYKTARSAKLADFQRDIRNYGYHMQAAWYLDGIEAVTGTKPQSFFFVVQEKEAPFLINVINLDTVAIEWGRLQNRRALRLFAECLSAGRWPGYSEDVETVGLPNWALRELQTRHEAGEFTLGGEAA